jgi:hypothetical protein
MYIDAFMRSEQKMVAHYDVALVKRPKSLVWDHFSKWTMMRRQGLRFHYVTATCNKREEFILLKNFERGLI